MGFLQHTFRVGVGRRLLIGSGGLLTLMLMTSCSEMPTGPTVAVMPSPNKPFEVFMQEEQLCRNWAAQSIGQAGSDVARDQFLGSTLAGAAIGATAGALMGGHREAGAGAAMGTAIGAASGSNQANVSAARAQRQYDIAYQQCMYAKGNMVPAYESAPYRYAAPPAASPPPPLLVPR